ncbi:MAG: type II toxin-antitoxin system RelE/ParE family toxin [Deltaproteobacteria bacterium]|nr:type II toxin-antitoxin system RelE/ParE family toxin [Deltaproteobacteria bacterium]MBI4224678.1 type II toxin-antitoxin system RelE/ParE family toxin [Deltaproteobacteria bacterium]
MSVAEEKEVRLFVTKWGSVPFETWLESLKDQRAVEKIEVKIARIRAGNLGDCKPVGKGVFELRIDHGPGYRIYFGQKGSQIILLAGGSKKRQNKDIKAAQNYWREER